MRAGRVAAVAARATAAYAIAACAIAACEPYLTEARNDALVARVHGGQLRLENLSADTVYYAVVEAETATRVDLAFCDAPERCATRVAPASAVSVALDAITGYGPDAREAIVYAWHLLPRVAPAGYTSRFLPTLRVRLR